MVVFRSPWKDVDIPEDVGLTDFILDQMKMYPDRIATIDSQTGQETTYTQLHHQVLSTASALHKRGFQKNDITAILSTNNLGFSLISLASIHLGGAAVGVNIKFTLDDMMRQFDICRPSYLAFSEEFQEVAEEIVKKYPHLKKLFILGHATNYESVYDLAKETVDLPEIKRDPKKDIAFYFFSSGTTGLPKGVPGMQYNILVSILRHGSDGPVYIPAGSTYGQVTPMYHLIGVACATLNCWCCGSTVVYFPKYDFSKMLAGIQRYKVSSLIAVSTIANSLAFDPIVDDYDISSLKMVIFTAAPASAEVLTETQKRLSIPHIRGGYGMTEMLAFTHFTYMEDTGKAFERGNVGKLLPNTLCKITDEEDGHELGKNETGEIWIKCKSVMTGYMKNPEATAAGFGDNGWWKTGDCGYVDDDENLFVLDRLKDMIKVYGEQVSPSGLEDILLKHEAVSETAIVGVPDQELGEIPKAFVVLNSGARTSKEELLEYVNERVADFQKLRGGIEFLDQLPKNAMNKVLRRELRTMHKK